MRTLHAVAIAGAALLAGCSSGATGPAGAEGAPGDAGPLPVVAAGAGLTGDGSAGAPLAVSFAGGGTSTAAARSDHGHDASYLTSAAADARYIAADAAGSFASASHDHDASYAAASHDHGALYRTRAEEDAAFSAMVHTHQYDDLVGKPDLSSFATRTELVAALADYARVADLPAPLTTAAFTGYAANASAFDVPADATAIRVWYTNVVAAAPSVFSMSADGALTVAKAGTVSVSASLGVVISAGRPLAELQIRVNDVVRSAGLAPPAGAAWSQVMATLHWAVQAGDVLTFHAVPDQIQTMTGMPHSTLTVLWTGVE